MAERQQNGKSSAPMILTGLIMILLFCVFAIFLVAQGKSIPNVEELREEVRLKNLADLNNENQRVLTQYHWVDKGKGVVGIPIDRAKDLVLAQLQSIKPHPAGPVNPPAAPQQQGTPAPSASAQVQKPAGQ